MNNDSKKKPKIAFLGPAPPLRGGISQFALNLARAFRERDLEVTMFNFIRQYPDKLFPSGSQFDPECTAKDIDIIGSFTPYLPYTWCHAVRQIRNNAPDLLIVSYWLPFFAPAYAFIISRLKDIKVIFLVHNVVSHERWPLGSSFRDIALSKADKLVVLSQSCLEDIHKLLPLRVARRTVLGFHPIYDSYGQYENQAKEIGKDTFTLLFFGLIKPYKGLDVLLKAFRLLLDRKPELRLIIAGDVYGDSSPYLELIRSLRLGDHVETHFRYIGDAEISSFFRQSDLCILPYKTATQSGVIATSYCFDVPVIASDVGGLSEYILPGKTGFLVRSEDPSALAETIFKALDRELLTNMQDEIKNYKKRFSWEALAELMLGL